jgi:hypothetical protein
MLSIRYTGIDFINDDMVCGAQKGHMDFGQVGFSPYTSKPCVHKITNLSPDHMFIINIEVLNKPPVSQKEPLVAPFHQLVNEQHNCRTYKLSLQPGEATSVSYLFFHVRVVLRGGKLRTTLEDLGGVVRTDLEKKSWEEDLEMGHSDYKKPCADMRLTNVGDSVFEYFICELC